MSSLQALVSRASEPEEEPTMTGEWLSAIETAKRLNLHISTVYRHLHAGTFPAQTMRVGRSWRICTADVDNIRIALRLLLDDAEPDAYASVLSQLIGES